MVCKFWKTTLMSNCGTAALLCLRSNPSTLKDGYVHQHVFQNDRSRFTGGVGGCGAETVCQAGDGQTVYGFAHEHNFAVRHPSLFNGQRCGLPRVETPPNLWRTLRSDAAIPGAAFSRRRSLDDT